VGWGILNRGNQKGDCSADQGEMGLSYGLGNKGSIFMRLCIVMSRRCLVPYFVSRKQIKTDILLKILSGTELRSF
jgi:hypothetical protein